MSVQNQGERIDSAMTDAAAASSEGGFGFKAAPASSDGRAGAAADVHSPSHEGKRPAELRRSRIRVARTAVVIAILVVYGIGVVLNTGLGSLSAFGVGGFAAICPLGALETMIAGRIVLPLPLIAIAAAVIGAVLFGRAFCSWICPVPLTRKLVTNKQERDAFAADRRKHRGAQVAKDRSWPGIGKNGTTALGVLAVTLVTTLVFGFPVFCLVCPIGLVFATIFAVIRLVVFNELIVDVIVFPALIVLELVVLRKWCATLCPVGALLGIFSRLNRTFRPTVDPNKCLAMTEGSACDACHAACNSDIDLVRSLGTGTIHDCTKCHECADHCPASAITFPVLSPRSGGCGKTER